MLTIEEADIIAETELDTEEWFELSDSVKQKYIVAASRNINKLRFGGRKTSQTQRNAFPRNGSSYIPGDVKEAILIEALHILALGDSVRKYVLNSGVTTHKVTGLSESYDLEYLISRPVNETSYELLTNYISNTARAL